MIVDHGRVVGNVARAAIVSNRRITGLSADVIVELVAELGPLWHERHQAKLASRPWKRAVGAGAKHRLVFADRLLATLVHLRHGATHDVLACWFDVDRSTITRAIGEVRPLLAERGCTVSPGVRLRTLTEVVDHLGASGETGIIDGTKIRVRRPAARTGTSSSPARASRTPSRPWSAPTRMAGSCSAVRPGPEAARTSPTPAS
ncbi:helix-turn-helix domain-containing protein [Streptomyces longwoodensis]|uniref:helix-turn-helix domain-containing protein n=1 Tax=Streptomyces longwoodensis TaxID=68231 RepID=UPI0033F904FA